MTASTLPVTSAGPDCYRTARGEGLLPALEQLTRALLPDAVPYGPGGHAFTTPAVAGSASRVWLDGTVRDRDPAVEHTIPVTAGRLVVLRHAYRGPGRPGAAGTGRPGPVGHESWLAALAWLRLGLSESLRRSVLSYLGGRRTGPTATLLQQQLVKGAVADAVATQLEVEAVLRADEAGDGVAERLHGLLTAADRTLVRLLGASGYLTGGRGEVADLSELLADAYCRGESTC
jgi:hypothetical protein